MDIITFIWKVYSDFTYNLSPAVFSFLLRANLLLLCPILAAFVGFSQLGLRSHRLQAVLMVIGILVASSVPLDRLLEPSALRPWLVFFLLLGAWFLPVLFSFLAHPGLGTQVKVLRITRITLVILFVLNLVFWR